MSVERENVSHGAKWFRVRLRHRFVLQNLMSHATVTYDLNISLEKYSKATIKHFSSYGAEVGAQR